MNIYFSDYLGVSFEDVEAYGAFDISLINDLPLFVDPFLLFNSPDPIYQGLHDRIIEYMKFLRDVSLTGTLRPHLLAEWFTFPEVTQNWLGFSLSGNRGHGLGLDFARALHQNLRSVFGNFGSETITQGSHVEKLCLIKDGVGRDNLSDFTTNLIKGHLAEYTQAFALEHIHPSQRRSINLRKVFFNYDTRSWAARSFDLPFVGGDYVLLTPKDMLTRDQAWINRPELLDRFVGIADSLPDAILRAEVNQYLLRVLPSDPRAPKRAVREAIGRAVAQFPQVLDYYVKDKEDHGEEAVSVAQAKVAAVEKQFVEQIKELVERYLKPTDFYTLRGNTYDEAMQRVRFLKDVIENKGGHRLFYVDGEPMRRESDLQILYRLTWFATASDISREVNDGRGPADFKASRGAGDKTLVEFKLAANSRLEQNLSSQTPVYEAASDATHPTLKVIVHFSQKQQERVERVLASLGLSESPHIVLIDARADNKPSGSRA